MSTTLSWTQARRIALRAQGMGPTRRRRLPRAATSRRALERTLEHTHLLQIDSVSVFARAHHLPVFTRTGSWDPAALESASRPGTDRLVRETLAHEATFATHEVHDLLAFRRRRAASQDWTEVRRAAREAPDLFARIRQAITDHGPLSAAAISRHLGDSRRGRGWGWRRTPSQWAVEYLFRAGELDCVGRSAQFERLYLLADGPGDDAAAGHRISALLEHRAAPPNQGHGEIAEAAAVLRLVGLASRSLGVSDPAAVADYFRLRLGQVRPAISELVRTGELEEVEVDHPDGPLPMLLHREAPQPVALRTAALVSPFDPIVFFRPRLKTMFDVDYRIGIYTPAARRTTGYYSLLFLLGDHIPARVDLKADRPRGVLQVRGTYREELPALRPPRGREEETVALALAEELRRAARWQGLDQLEVATGAGTGQLSAPLASCVTGTGGAVS